MPDFSGTSERPFLLRLEPSRWLPAWWYLLHLVLSAAIVAANLPVPACLFLNGMLGLHAWLRFPCRSALLLVCPGGRFALPAEGRFNLSLTPASRCGGFWVELVFDDRPRSKLLLIRDQFTDSGWRRLHIALHEWI